MQWLNTPRRFGGASPVSNFPDWLEHLPNLTTEKHDTHCYRVNADGTRSVVVVSEERRKNDKGHVCIDVVKRREPYEYYRNEKRRRTK